MSFTSLAHHCAKPGCFVAQQLLAHGGRVTVTLRVQAVLELGCKRHLRPSNGKRAQVQDGDEARHSQPAAGQQLRRRRPPATWATCIPKRASKAGGKTASQRVLTLERVAGTQRDSKALVRRAEALRVVRVSMNSTVAAVLVHGPATIIVIVHTLCAY